MNNSRLKIKYGSIEFEIESDPATIEKERTAFLETLPSIAVLSKMPSGSENYNELIEQDETKLISLKDDPINANINVFMNEKGFSTDIDKCLAIIYFMNVNERIEYVDSSNVKERMQKAKLSIPRSISVAFNGLTTKGFIQPIDQEDKGLTKYYITDEGKSYIESYVKKDRKIKSSAKKNKLMQTSVENRYSFLTKEMMQLEKYPDFSKLNSTKEKIMLIMYILKDIEKGEYFTINELTYIVSNIFNERLTLDAIKGVFKNASSAKYFDKKYLENNNKIYEYKMIQSGFNYFKENVMK